MHVLSLRYRELIRMMHTTYNVSLVVLSVIIAIAGSYTALDLSSRTRETEGWPRQAFVGAAAPAWAAASGPCTS